MIEDWSTGWGETLGSFKVGYGLATPASGVVVGLDSNRHARDKQNESSRSITAKLNGKDFKRPREDDPDCQQWVLIVT
jgi:hypothetical protein